MLWKTQAIIRMNEVHPLAQRTGFVERLVANDIADVPVLKNAHLRMQVINVRNCRCRPKHAERDLRIDRTGVEKDSARSGFLRSHALPELPFDTPTYTAPPQPKKNGLSFLLGTRDG